MGTIGRTGVRRRPSPRLEGEASFPRPQRHRAIHSIWPTLPQWVSTFPSVFTRTIVIIITTPVRGGWGNAGGGGLLRFGGGEGG